MHEINKIADKSYIIGNVIVVDPRAERAFPGFVGVKDGVPPTADNRFLMERGLEIYDVGIAERPVRLSQLETDGRVTGIAVLGDEAYLAAGAAGG